MQKLRMATISGTGMAVPNKVVSNAELEKLMDTSDEWIVQRSGIKERRFVEEHDTPSSLAESASRKALAAANLKPSDIELILVATLSPEYYFPGTSSLLQAKLGCGTVPALDIRAQCSGFIFALSTARQFIATGQYSRVLVCGVEVHSRGLDLTTRGRDTAVLFGDGAGAVVLEASEEPEHGIISTHLYSEGQYANRLWVEAPTMGKSPHINAAMIEEGRIYPQMDGKFVFKNAITRMPQVVREALEKNNLKTSDIDLFLFHQANLRINEMVAHQLGIKPEQTHNNIEKYGNCSAASIPILIDECVQNGKLKRNKLVCLTSFGSGFTWGAAIMRWS